MNVVRDNLKRIASACFAKGKTMKPGQSTFGLIVYGGICPLSEIACHNAVDEAFDVVSNLKSWHQVGTVPFTKKCLENPKVWHDRTDDRDPIFDVYQDIQLQNDFSVMQLNAMGYGGYVLRAQFLVDKIRERQAAAYPVTVAQTRERQEAIVAANTTGKHCFDTGGRDAHYNGRWVHCCGDEGEGSGGCRKREGEKTKEGVSREARDGADRARLP
jgi:hypothetical protein